VGAVLNDVRFTLMNRHLRVLASGPKSANRRHRACTAPDNFLSEDLFLSENLAFTRTGQSEHGFSFGESHSRLPTLRLRA
jgi:hypothetical protein